MYSMPAQDPFFSSLPWSSSVNLALIAVAFLLFKVLQDIYQLYLHPLAEFPGPRAAALSASWEMNLVKNDYPEKVFERLHKEYNTRALRIGPNALHITDPTLYGRLYSQTKAFQKDPAFYSPFNVLGEIPTSFTHTDISAHHAVRRAVIGNFSKQTITKLEPMIQDKMQQVGQKLEMIASNGPINVQHMFQCYITDVVTQYCFGGSIDLIHKSPDSFEVEFQEAFKTTAIARYNLTASRLLRYIFDHVPSLRWYPALHRGREGFKMLRDIGLTSMKAHKSRTEPASHPVILDKLSSKLADEKTEIAESFNLLIAGADTTAVALAIAFHHVLLEPKVATRLVGEVDHLFESLGRFPTVAELEKSEYVHAVVKESLRIAMPTTCRLPRLVPSDGEPLIVDGQVVPAGSQVGISAYTMHFCTDVWGAEPKKFNPERWMGEGNAKRLEQYFVTFSKGARSCSGMNLAYAEIYIAIAFMFRHFEMTLLNRGKIKSKDYFIRMIEPPGIQVEFKKRETA